MLKIQEFIRDHKDWRDIIVKEPYFIGISEKTMFGRNMVLLKYNQRESDFTQDIVRECRGLILDSDTNEVICHPFEKFFNFGEPCAAEIDWSTAFVSEKLDGCVSFDTMVKTTVGDVPMKEICEHPDKYQVLTFNHDSNEIESNTIDAVSVKDSVDNWYEIELDDGRKLTVTGNHKIWCENLHCYRRVDELDGTEEFSVI